MRMRNLVAATAAVLVAGCLTVTSGASAQSNPSADDMIKMLKPTGSMTGGTRGIRPANAASSTAPAQPAAPIAGVAPSPSPSSQTAAAAAPLSRPAPAPAASAGPSVDLTINFQNGSAELTPDAVKTLSALGKALSSSDLSAFRFRIEGHTDTVGSRDYNISLSQARANKVAEFLEKNFGVAGGRLEAVGKGPEGLLVPTPDQTAEPRNRRVQVINLGA